MANNVDISKITGINQVGNSYQRKSAVPLDYYSLFNTKAEAETYAASNPVSYVGQVISYIDNGEVKVCVIANTDGLLREVGTKPVGDDKTIEVSAEGAVALLGAASAADGTLPMLEDGALVWKTLEDIGAGDGNDNTTYEFSFENEKITIIPKENGVAKDAIELDLSAFVTATELASAREEISAEIDADVKVAKDRADAAYALAEAKLDAAAYATDKAALDAEDAAVRKIAEDVRDAFNVFMTSEDIDETVNTLKEIQAEIEKMTDATELTQALASKVDSTYVNEELAKKQDVIPANTYDAFGAAATAKEEAIADAAEKYYGKADVYTKSEADELLNAKANAADVYAKSEVYTKGEADQAIADKISEVNGGESAGEVLGQLNAYKKIVNMEVWGNENAEGDSRIDDALARVEALEGVGAQANVIESVVGVAENRLAVSTSGKTVTIDDSGLRVDIADAKKAGTDAAQTASEAMQKANENAGLINANDATIKLLQQQDTTHTEQIAALVQHDNDHTALYDALNATVSTHGTDIAGLKSGKADVTVTDGLASRITANEGAIKTLNETTVPAINAEIAKKANAADVYTKSEVNAITGTVAEGKTLAKMIEEAQAAATYDDTAINALISANAIAIGVNAEAIQTNANAIADIEALLNTVDSEDTITSLKELAIWVGEHGEEAAEMAGAINDNADAIKAINHTETGILAVAKAYADEKVAAIPAATAEALGLVKFDNNTVKMNESKQLYVAKVSTDTLEQGELTLVLRGGSASE